MSSEFLKPAKTSSAPPPGSCSNSAGSVQKPKSAIPWPLAPVVTTIGPVEAATEILAEIMQERVMQDVEPSVQRYVSPRCPKTSKPVCASRLRVEYARRAKTMIIIVSARIGPGKTEPAMVGQGRDPGARWHLISRAAT